MIRIHAVALVFCFVLSNMLIGQEIEPVRRFSGKNAQMALRKIAPANRAVINDEQWNNLWLGWQTDEPKPEIDFEKFVVLVETVDGPNNMFTNTLKLDGTGNLKYEVASTRMAGPGFAYLMLVVPREGIQSVNGRPLLAAPPKPAPKKIDEIIRVEMIGQIKTGGMAIGGETTGTMIMSKGIVWELDFQGNQQFEEVARLIGDRPAYVLGQLTRIDGVEIQNRIVLLVEMIKPAILKPAGSQETPVANNEPKRLESNPSKPRIPAAEPAPQVNERQDNRAPTRIRGEMRTADVAPSRSFRNISVLMSGGPTGVNQEFVIKPDGSVTNVDKKESIEDAWSLTADNLAELDGLIDQTIWSQVPKISRTPNAVDAFAFSFLIEKNKETLRFYADGQQLAQRKELRKILELINKSSNAEVESTQEDNR